MSTEEYVYVRLAPYAPRHGNKVRRYNCGGITFVGGDNPHWYRVGRDFADRLKELRQEPHNELSRHLFEIKESGEKEEIQAEEHRRRLAAMGVMTPTQPVPHDFKPAKEVDMLSATGGAITSSEATGRAAALPPERGEEAVDEDIVEPVEAPNARRKRRRRTS